MHPMVGRFMQKDPLMYVDGMNDYSYVVNRVANYIDSYGLNWSWYNNPFSSWFRRQQEIAGQHKVSEEEHKKNVHDYNKSLFCQCNDEQQQQNPQPSNNSIINHNPMSMLDNGLNNVNDWVRNLNDTNTNFYADKLNISDETRNWMLNHPYQSLAKQGGIGGLIGVGTGLIGAAVYYAPAAISFVGSLFQGNSALTFVFAAVRF